MQVHLRIQAYAAGRDRVDEHTAAKLARLATQSVGSEESGEGAPVPSLAEKLAALSGRVRTVGNTKNTRSRDRAAKFFEEHGGLSESWGAWSRSDGKRRKPVKLAGSDADPEAAAAAMNGAVNGEGGAD